MVALYAPVHGLAVRAAYVLYNLRYTYGPAAITALLTHTSLSTVNRDQNNWVEGCLATTLG